MKKRKKNKEKESLFVLPVGSNPITGFSDGKPHKRKNGQLYGGIELVLPKSIDESKFSYYKTCQS